MKEILFIVTTLFLSFSSSAETLLGTVQTRGHVCRLIPINNELIFTGKALKKDANGKNKLTNDGRTYIKYSDLDSFVSLVKYAREKYVEWSATAVKNNITELDSKDIDMQDFSLRMCGFDFPSGETITWNEGYLTCQFYIVKGVKVLAFHSNVNYPLHGSSYLEFSSVSQIDKFLSFLNMDLINKALEKETAKDNLFK